MTAADTRVRLPPPPLPEEPDAVERPRGTNPANLPRAIRPTLDRLSISDEEAGRLSLLESLIEVAEPEPDPYLGMVFAGRYVVDKAIGRGGMGVVYLGRHLLLGRQVAIKVLAEEFARVPEYRRRFLQEAQAASLIGHEHVIDILDVGEAPRGSVFFTMEFLAGQTLAERMAQAGRLQLTRIRHVMLQLCSALGAAHAHGVVHRDVKPDNIFLVERRGDPDFVKVLDFGVAKLALVDVPGEVSPLTSGGNVLGTPHYMSPEQARGERVDHRTDVYSAGCVLYELLTGTVPFDGDTALQVLNHHVAQELEPPNLRAPSVEVPADFERVVLRAMAKDRADRFQSMAEFAAALSACGPGDPRDGIIEPQEDLAPTENLPTGRTGLRLLPWLILGLLLVAGVAALSLRGSRGPVRAAQSPSAEVASPRVVAPPAAPATAPAAPAPAPAPAPAEVAPPAAPVSPRPARPTARRRAPSPVDELKPIDL